jgi:hypothetical protein
MLFQKILADLKQKIVAQGAYKTVVSDVLTVELGTTITPDMVIGLKDGVLTLGVSPTLRSVISLKKEALIRALQKENVMVYVIR